MSRLTDDELVDRVINGLARDVGMARERFKDALTWRSETGFHQPPSPPPASSDTGVQRLSPWWKLW